MVVDWSDSYEASGASSCGTNCCLSDCISPFDTKQTFFFAFSTKAAQLFYIVSFYVNSVGADDELSFQKESTLTVLSTDVDKYC